MQTHFEPRMVHRSFAELARLPQVRKSKGAARASSPTSSALAGAANSAHVEIVWAGLGILGAAYLAPADAEPSGNTA